MNIAIIDYKCGNLTSLKNALRYLGYQPKVTLHTNDVNSSDCIIFPGVGSFGQGIRNLYDAGLVSTLREAVLEKKIPILGICLGAQLLLEESEEHVDSKGLGILKGNVTKLNKDHNIRVPHMGWNRVRFKKNAFDSLDGNFYFAHSYRMNLLEDSIVTATCQYGEEIHVAYQKDNIYGCQFHPEKSQKDGILYIKKIIEEII